MNNDTNYVAENNSALALVEVKNNYLVSYMITGASVGLLATLLTVLLGKYVYSPVFCSGEVVNCGAVLNYSVLTATMTASIAGLVALITMRMIRPAVVVVLSVATVWGVQSLLLNASWLWAGLTTVFLFAMLYAVYSWVVRVRSVSMMIIFSLLCLVTLRLVLNS